VAALLLVSLPQSILGLIARRYSVVRPAHPGLIEGSLFQKGQWSVLIQANSTLVFIGDSITDCDRERPIGEGNGLGNGYVSLVNAWLGSDRPQHGIRVINVGTSGNTVRDLDARWQEDVIDLDPDWLSVMIGINDVWRQFDSPFHVEEHVSLAEYSAVLEKLIQATRAQLKGLILMAPYFIEPNLSDPMRVMMDRYGDIVRQLAHKYEAVFVDTQSAFDVVLKSTHPMSLAADRVHPNLTGHVILARAFLDAIGLS
jgi:lysophospholipase L1-like esterase